VINLLTQSGLFEHLCLYRLSVVFSDVREFKSTSLRGSIPAFGRFRTRRINFLVILFCKANTSNHKSQFLKGHNRNQKRTKGADIKTYMVKSHVLGHFFGSSMYVHSTRARLGSIHH
jgi:hypothetical protein